jgi:hypothetical protein
MRKQPKPLTDEQLLSAVRRQAEKGTKFLDSKLSLERQEVTEYYLGRRPFPLREGGSKFVSQDVYLSVENMKAELVETFGAGSQIVQFRPQGPDDLAQAKHATAYCEVAIHQQNDGLLIFQDVVHDSLTARVGIAKVYWDQREDVTGVYRWDRAPIEQAALTLQEPEVRLTRQPKIDTDPETGQRYITGEFETFTDTSQVVVETVPPEEFIIGGRTRSLRKARYLAHRYRTTLGDLVEDGYDPKLVYSIMGSDDDLELDEEALQRELETNGSYLTDDDAEDEAGRMVTVYESYIRIDALGNGTQQLWKVVHCGSTLLEKQRVNDHPFLAFVPQPIPHTFMGDNFAARTINHANTKTTLTRAIIEQAVDATNPRWQVARGGVANPRELIDNRRGGVVNVRDVNSSVAPLPQNPINPFVLQTIQMVDSDREDTTGISRLATGLDKKALSHQNSQGLVEQLTQNSKTRAKVIARNFALQFVAQLYLKVYQLALENETQERMLEIGGQFVPVDPRTWRQRRSVAVDMTLGYGERDQRVAELADLHKAFEGSPKLSRMYGEQQAFNLWRDTLEIKGIKNITDYLADPSSLGEAEPDPKMMAEVDKLKKETEVMERQQALREAQVQDQIARENAEAEWRRITGQAELSLKARDAARKDRETDNRIDIGLAELELAVDAQVNAAPENTRLTAIASPNS